MVLPIDFKTKGSLASSQSTRHIQPGVSGEIRKKIVIGDIVLEAGSKAIIQPTDNPNQFKITPYTEIESSNPDLPESERDVKTGDTQLVTLDKPTKHLKFNDEHYARTDTDLFPVEGLSIEHVRQGRVPNCFFLAAVAEILNHPDGDAYIRSMMRQNEDGTTTVRLYNPKSLEPVYITVDNSYIIDSDGALNNHEEFWVTILEKAYLGLSDELQKNDISMRSVYSGGGHRITALAVLTGKKVVDKTMDFEFHLAWDVATYFEGAVERVSAILPFKEHMSGFDDLVNEELRGKNLLKPFKEIYGDDALALEKSRELLMFYIDNRVEWDNEVKNSPPSLNDLANLILKFKSEPSIQEILKSLSNYYYVVNENKVRIEMPTYSGLYSPEQLDVFNDIKQSMQAGKLMTAGTYKKEHYGNDEKTDMVGLRATHAYSVLNVIEKTVAIPGSSKMQVMYFVQLRNPWGVVGRVDMPDVDTGEFIATEQRAAGVFNVPLVDFCRLFRSYSVTDSVNHEFTIAVKKEKIAEDMLSIMSDWSVGAASNHLELIETYDRFLKCEKSMVDLEMSQLDCIDAATLKSMFDILDSKELESETKAFAVKGLIEVKDFSFVSANDEHVKDYVYQLLLAKWHANNNTLTLEVNAILKQAVYEQYKGNPLWDNLEENVAGLKFIVAENVKKNFPVIESNVDDLIIKLTKLADSIPQESGDMREFYLKLYFANYEALMLCIKNVYEYSVLLDKLDIDIYDSELDKIEGALNSLSLKTNALLEQQDARDIHKDIMKGVPTQSIWQNSHEGVKNIAQKLDMLGYEIKQYQPASEVEVEQKQELIGFFENFKALFSSLVQSITNLFNSEVKPHKQNSYEVQAKGDMLYINPAKTVHGTFRPLEKGDINEEVKVGPAASAAYPNNA